MNSQGPTLAELGRRLERLEKENRWLKGGLSVSATIVGAFFLLGAQRQNDGRLDAQQLVLRDRNGVVRMDLNGNGPHLKLFDDKGVIRAELFGDHLKFFDAKQLTRAQFFGDNLKFFNGKEKTRAQLFADHLKFFDDNEITQAEVFWSHLRFFDKREKPLVELDGQIPRLRLLTDGKEVFTTASR
jgi:hypothetical protein